MISHWLKMTQYQVERSTRKIISYCETFLYYINKREKLTRDGLCLGQKFIIKKI